MKCPISKAKLLIAIALPLALGARAQSEFEALGFTPIGEIAPRHARDIESSNWSVGAETMDRDYTVYANWKQYLGPLGIKKARIQGGWAKTEKVKGVYDWVWLDEIIHDMHAQGVEPWMCLCYGNPLYPSGGGTLLGAVLPASGEALDAWKRWITATVARYGRIIDEWEVWNEPDNRGVNSAEAYADFLVETAKSVRAVQPQARILAMSTAGVRIEFIDRTLALLEARLALGLVDEVTYHPYKPNPDSSYAEVEKLRAVVAGYSDRIGIRQGENGCPSELRKTKALSGLPWSETSQAKWALRRLLGDLGRDIPSSYFSIMDMKYPDEMNRKGLLLANDDMTVARPKEAYFAVQHLASVFTGDLVRSKEGKLLHDARRSLSGFLFTNTAKQDSLIALWFDDEVPGDSVKAVPIYVEAMGVPFSDPVLVDLRTGRIYALPKGSWKAGDPMHVFAGVPCYDSPVLIADRALLRLKP